MAIKYGWLAERLELLILKNIQAGIHKLPTEQQFCTRYHISHQTMRMAMAILEEKGLIVRKQGSGAYITGRSQRPLGNVTGILISSDQEYIYPGVISDIQGTLSSHRLTGQVFVTDNQVKQEREVLLELLKNPLRALVVEGYENAFPNPNLGLHRKLMKKNCQIVFLHGYYPAPSGCIHIKDDNVSGSALLMGYLVRQGHTAIGDIFESDNTQGIRWYQGFAETVRDMGIPVSGKRVSWYGSHQLDRLSCHKDAGFLKEVIEESLGGCTAVICYNDIIAYYLMDELLNASYKLPTDVAIAVFDNTYFSDSPLLTVTTLSHEPHKMGTKAAQVVIQKLSGPPVLSQETRWKLNLEESTQTDR